MDANQTRFHLLLGQADWSSCTGEGVGWDDDRKELTLKPVVFKFKPPPGDRFPAVEDRRGSRATGMEISIPSTSRGRESAASRAGCRWVG